MNIHLKKKYKIVTDKTSGISKMKVFVPDSDSNIKRFLKKKYSIKFICDAILAKQKGLEWGDYVIEEEINHQKGNYVFHITLNN